MSGEKREPISHAVNPGVVSQIGVHEAHTRPPQPLYAGRGIEAPKAATTIHHSGSQGKHR
jgi:hypothetical protein